MDYFYVEPEQIQSTILFIRGDEFKHLARVLRKKPGETVYVTDGIGRTLEVIIRYIGHDQAECEVVNIREGVNEPKVEVTLGVSLLRNPVRFDFLVEKTTELGVRRIIPLLCERTIPQHAKIARYQKIALSAMKQSCRSLLPEIVVLTKFELLVENYLDFELKMIPHEKTEQSQYLGTVLRHHPSTESILIAIGPEGGFTDKEIEFAAQRSFVPISLGPRRLRSETAAISSVCSIVRGW